MSFDGMSTLAAVESVHEIAIARSNNPEDHKSKTKALEKLVGNFTLDDLTKFRQAYVDRYFVDPEHHLRNFDVYQEDAKLRLHPSLLFELLGILNKSEVERDTEYLRHLLAKAESATLSSADRQAYYSWLPRIGLWDAPARETSERTSVSSYERLLRIKAWEKISSLDFDAALLKIERSFSTATVRANTPREKTVAVIASSHGAQWQELIDWALGMLSNGYALQVFTPYGRPVAIQRDSMLVREPPTEAIAVALGLPGVGLGAPLRLDPLRLPADRLKYLMGNAMCADKFDPQQFGAVYLAGGLGFNEDVAVTSPKGSDPTHAWIEPTPNIATMMRRAIEHRLPMIALCHGPTLLACFDIEINGVNEKLVKGVKVAALPALEPMVHAQGKLEPQFSFFTWKTHDVLAEAGALVDEAEDLKDMTVVKTGVKDGLHLVTGPGPQTAMNLIGATMSVMKKRWESSYTIPYTTNARFL
ncbi:uncharacterized protein N0V89_011311 [Didymosphaeria variabile]|uniref:Uncharacterized protein n=1 Tax=Didymosphaeria variabile TaxID=1932322 RepID=A0A9W8XCY3_9PLEO|nr:uncharacterized protein N0V89_011311 [Didymosphaeria variabile]KAJ4347370.1 hypothetical protein N0V89_011311 [Didymosphaeria variabile]